VERRAYLPLAGLILAACEFAPRFQWPGRPIYWFMALLVLYTGLCHQRNQLWGQPERLWIAAATQSRRNARPYWQVAEDMVRKHRCDAAIPYLRRGEQLMPNEYGIHVGWAKVLECSGRKDEALQRLEHAVRLQPSSPVYQWLGLLYGASGRLTDAGAALEKAVQLEPGSGNARSALGLWHESVHDLDAAVREYRTALQLDPHNREAHEGLARIQREISQQQRHAGISAP
jgi:tetratricopeptide (TPR) repeat protein